MSEKTMIRLTCLLASVLVLELAIVAVRSTIKQHTCAADNQQYHAVLSAYKPGDITTFSKAMTQLSKDNCTAEER